MLSIDGKNIFLLSNMEGTVQDQNAARSENIKWGIQRSVESGKSKIFDQKCFGYSQDSDGNLIIQESEATIVKIIFDLYLNGYSINAIRKELQNQQIKSPTGHEVWSKRTVETMLQNEKYTGDVLVMKTYSEGFPTVTRKTNRGERNQFIAVGSHPAIIPKEIFEKVAAMREQRSNVIKDSDGYIRKPTRYSMKRAMVKTE